MEEVEEAMDEVDMVEEAVDEAVAIWVKVKQGSMTQMWRRMEIGPRRPSGGSLWWISQRFFGLLELRRDW